MFRTHNHGPFLQELEMSVSALLLGYHRFAYVRRVAVRRRVFKIGHLVRRN
jgi:hypothetical protein